MKHFVVLTSLHLEHGDALSKVTMLGTKGLVDAASFPKMLPKELIMLLTTLMDLLLLSKLTPVAHTTKGRRSPIIVFAICMVIN